MPWPQKQHAKPGGIDLASQRPGVAAHSRGHGHCRSGERDLRMPPPRRDLGQWPHHEQPVGRAGVWQDQAVAIPLLPTIGDQVQVQRARPIGGCAPSSERLLDPTQGRHQGVGIMVSAHDDDAVHEGRVARVGPGLRRPPARADNHIDPFEAKPVQRRVQRLAARGPDPLVIAAQRDDDGGVQIQVVVDIDADRFRLCD